MPTVAIVEGVKIQFYLKEHPPPHFHALFAEHRAQIDIASLTIIRGHLPRSKLQAVLSWTRTRRAPLEQAWDAVMAKLKPERIV